MVIVARASGSRPATPSCIPSVRRGLAVARGMPFRWPLPSGTASGAGCMAYPLTPVIVMPWMNFRWATKKMISSGRIDSSVIAMVC